MKIFKLAPLLLLTGCAASVIDAGVTASTGKSVASHALSDVHKQDCNTLNAFKGMEVCNKIYYGQTYYKKSPKDLLEQY